MILNAYNHNDLIKACKSVSLNDWQDVRSEITTKMLEMSDDRLSNIKNILAYMVRSAYYIQIDNVRKDRPIHIDDLTILTEIETDNSHIIEKIKKDLNHPKRFYHAKVFLYCVEHKSIKEFSRKIGIPYNEIRQTFLDYKKYIRQWAKSK